MRAWLILPLMLAGCDYTAPPPLPSDTAAGQCARPSWQPARTANLLITNVTVDISPVMPAFDPSLTVDGEPAACVAPDGRGAKWFFTVGGEPFGSVLLIPERQGDNDMVSEGTVEINLFGAEEGPVFRGADIRFGSWTVESLLPTFETSLVNVSAQKEGRFLELTLMAEATP